MFNDNPETGWVREFDRLGANRVRGAVAGGAGWERDKKQAARRWLERQDMKAWQERRKDLPPDHVNLRQRLRKSRVWLYVGGAIAIGMVGARVFRIF